MTSHINIGTCVPVSIHTIEARPSKVVKTPYVCDITVDDTLCQAHTPSLGCNGMVDKGASVITVKREGSKGKCSHGVIGSLLNLGERSIVVGVDPSLAERFAGNMLKTGLGDKLRVKPGVELQSQKTYDDCRFDYCGIADDGRPFICEVKNVSIAEYDDIPPKQRAKLDYSGRDPMTKTAVFPSGYKPKDQTHSERALKHTNTLARVKQENPEMRCVILFVVQRDDAIVFQPCNGDQIYKEALKNAKEAGVEIYAARVSWHYDSAASTATPTYDRTGCLMDVNI